MHGKHLHPGPEGSRGRHSSCFAAAASSTMNSSSSQRRRLFSHDSASTSNKLLVVAAIICSISYNFKLANEALAETQLREKLTYRPPSGQMTRGGREVSLADSIHEIFSFSRKQLKSGRFNTNGDNEMDATRSHLRNVSTSRRHPRRVTLVPLTSRKLARLKLDSIPPDAPIITQRWHDLNALDYLDGGHEDECEPMYKWQLEGFPSCNAFHEINMKELRLINSGGSRTAFEVKSPLEGREKKYVFKTIKWSRADRMNPQLVDEQRKDSLVMMKTANDFIPPVWGYCSVAVLMDFMPEGSMHDYIKGARLAGGSPLSPVDRLRIAVHISSAVADLHTIDHSPIPSFFHNDIDGHQFLYKSDTDGKGRFMLNDFNYARPILRNKETKKQCRRDTFGMAVWKGRSLEELQDEMKGDLKPMEPDRVDVWMMGNPMYYILTDLYTWEEPKTLTWQQSAEKLLSGKRSPYPNHIVRSKDPAHIAMMEGIDMCWTHKWQERPSARQVADHLMNALRNITGKEEPDVRIVLPERDPNQRSTESDYNDHND